MCCQVACANPICFGC
ncbi:hypothetical protein [Terriglobus sp.]